VFVGQALAKVQSLRDPSDLIFFGVPQHGGLSPFFLRQRAKAIFFPFTASPPPFLALVPLRGPPRDSNDLPWTQVRSLPSETTPQVKCFSNLWAYFFVTQIHRCAHAPLVHLVLNILWLAIDSTVWQFVELEITLLTCSFYLFFPHGTAEVDCHLCRVALLCSSP